MLKKIINCFFILFMPASVCRRRYQRITNERIAYIENTYHMEIAYLTRLICEGGNIGESFKEVLPKITGLNTPGLFVATFRPCNSQTMSGHVFTEIEGESQFDSIGGPEDNKSVGTGTVNIRGRGRIKALDYYARIHDSNGNTGEINLIVEDNVENASIETARLALSNQHKRYAIKISGWIMLLLGLSIVLMSREIVFPGLERLLGIETIVGAKNVVYCGNGDYYYTNPGAMIKWIAATAATGVSIAVIGAIILIRVKRKA